MGPESDWSAPNFLSVVSGAPLTNWVTCVIIIVVTIVTIKIPLEMEVAPRNTLLMLHC